MRSADAWRQSGLITLGACAVLGAYFLLPAGPRLGPMDFLGDLHAVLQFCDPANPRPLPATAGQPGVSLLPDPVSAGSRGRLRTFSFKLVTISGKPVTPEDLAPQAGSPVEFTVTDPSGAPVPIAASGPGAAPGRWTAAFAPTRPGTYRVRARFTPVATQSGMEASCLLSEAF
jgi:hypothetical protein